MEKMEKIKLFYINLERRPDRKAFIENQLKNIKCVDFERFEAIDGKRLIDFGVNNTEFSYFKKANFLKTQFSKNIIGNFLSHFRLLQKIVEENIPIAIISQDDMQLYNNFEEELAQVIKELPEDAELVNIAFHKSAVYEKVIPWDLKNQTRDTNNLCRKISENIGIGHESVNPCSSMYIVTQKGARNFIEHIETNGVFTATDHEMNIYLKRKNIYYFSRLVLATGAQLGSDVFS